MEGGVGGFGVVGDRGRRGKKEKRERKKWEIVEGFFDGLSQMTPM